MMNKKTFIFGIIFTVFYNSLLLLTLFYATPLNLKKMQNISPVVLDAKGEILRAFTVEDGLWRLPVQYTDVSKDYLQQLVIFEDKRFWSHPGVDVLALARAFKQFILEGRIVSGGSTLTMQAVRLLEPRPRTVKSKLIEMLRAVQLEQRFNKKEILEIYLTLAPFGGNIEGIMAASLQYFNKKPKWLTPAEAALLVALPQSPSRLLPYKYPKRALIARNKVITRVISKKSAIEAKAEPIPQQKYVMPFLAPLAARRLVSDKTSHIYQTSLNRRWQSESQTTVRSFVSNLHPKVSAAVLAVNNYTSEVVVYIGSADFFNSKRAGQVDMVSAIRSPGSTLKPFIYGLGFDDKTLHPLTVVQDIPTLFGDYAPQNFFRDFTGEVTVTKALQQSLNVPAVSVLKGIGPKRFAQTLSDAGVPLYSLAPPSLPIALGGVGYSLESLVKLYAAIAGSGGVRDFKLHQEQVLAETKDFLSIQTAGYLRNILQGIERPVGFMSSNSSKLQQKIAFKTGTSYGYRDAWAIGLSNNYTIGVWVGIPNGTPHHNFIGLDASKLMLQVFDIVLTGNKEKILDTPPISKLPEGLKYWPRKTSLLSKNTVSDDLRLMFPPTNTVLSLQNNPIGQPQPFILKVAHGIRPYQWLVNGEYKGKSTIEGRFLWNPDEAGAYRITVIDAKGSHASAHIWLK